MKLNCRSLSVIGLAGLAFCLAGPTYSQEHDSLWRSEPYKTWESWVAVMEPMARVVTNPDGPPTSEQRAIRWSLQRIYLLLVETSLECHELGSDVRAFDQAASRVVGTNGWLVNGKYTPSGSAGGSVISPEFSRLRADIEAAHERDKIRFCRVMYHRFKKNGDLAKIIDRHLGTHLDTVRREPQYLWHVQEVCRSPDAYYGPNGSNGISRTEIANAIRTACALAGKSESAWGKIP